MILLIRPSFDAVTTLINKWAEQVKNAMIKSGREWAELSNEDATRTRVEDYIKSYNVDNIFFYGYGTAWELLGNGLYPDTETRASILDPLNIASFKFNFIYAVASDSARGLGRFACKYNTNCYLGYLGPLVLSPAYHQEFGDCVNSGVIAMILEKSSAGNAFNIIRETFDKHTLKILSSGTGANPVEASIASGNFLKARQYLCLVGNPDISLDIVTLIH